MTTTDRKAGEKRLRRQTILKCAKKIIAKSGVEEMNMNQLAEATELNKATLYLYFTRKDDLIDFVPQMKCGLFDRTVKSIISFDIRNPVYPHN